MTVSDADSPPALIVTTVVPALKAQKRPEAGSETGFPSDPSRTACESAEARFGSTKSPMSGREELKVYCGKSPLAQALPTQFAGIGVYRYVWFSLSSRGDLPPASGRRASPANNAGWLRCRSTPSFASIASWPITGISREVTGARLVLGLRPATSTSASRKPLWPWKSGFSAETAATYPSVPEPNVGISSAPTRSDDLTFSSGAS